MLPVFEHNCKSGLLLGGMVSNVPIVLSRLIVVFCQHEFKTQYKSYAYINICVDTKHQFPSFVAQQEINLFKSILCDIAKNIQN